MAKIVIGIDPGNAGGIAVINGNNVMTKKMPETAKDVYDFFKKFSKLDVVCVLEKVGGMPGMTGSGMFNFGKGYGYLELSLLALGIKTYSVTPQKWQKEYSLGNTKSGGKLTTTQWKNVLKAKSQQLFPKVKVFLWSSDALLIAEYGVRNYLNNNGIQNSA